MLRKAARGFTLIELMIVVAIIGILASIAIPNFLRYQLRSKSGEAAVNLGAIKTNEVAYYGSHDAFVSTTLHPAAISTGTRQDFLTGTPADWDELGWKPEGTVYFQYEVVAAGVNPQTFTANALANLDNAGVAQCWSFRKDTDGAGAGAQTDNALCTNAGTVNVFNQVVKTSADGEY